MKNQLVTLFDRIQACYQQAQRNESSCFFFACYPFGENANLREDIFEAIESQWRAIKKSANTNNLDLALLNEIVVIAQEKNKGMAPQFISTALAKHFNLTRWRQQYRMQFGTLHLHSFGKWKEYYWVYKVSEIEALNILIHQQLTCPNKKKQPTEEPMSCVIN